MAFLSAALRGKFNGNITVDGTIDATDDIGTTASVHAGESVSATDDLTAGGNVEIAGVVLAGKDDWFDAQYAYAKSKGLNVASKTFADDFGSIALSKFLATVTVSNTADGGVAIVGPTGAVWPQDDTQSLVANIQTKHWLMASWAKVATASDVAVTIGMTDPSGVTPTAYVGYNNAIDAGHFVGVLDDGTPTHVVGPAIDANYHLFRAWSDGTTVHFEIDGVEFGTLPASDAPASAGVVVVESPPGSAGVVHADKYMIATQKAA